MRFPRFKASDLPTFTWFQVAKLKSTQVIWFTWSLWHQVLRSILFMSSILTRVLCGRYQHGLGINFVWFLNSLGHLLHSKGFSQAAPLWAPLLCPCPAPLADQHPREPLGLPSFHTAPVEPHHLWIPFCFHTGIKCHTTDHWSGIPEQSPKG